MNVKYYTAFQRVVHHIKTTPDYTIDNGAETLAVVFNMHTKYMHTALREALK